MEELCRFSAILLPSSALTTAIASAKQFCVKLRLETSGGVLSTVDMVVQQRNCRRRLRDSDDDDDDDVLAVQVPCV